jgi:hypothetical protein
MVSSHSTPGNFVLTNTPTDSYILVFEQGQLTPNKFVNDIRTKIIEFGGKINHEYTNVLTGFAFSLPTGDRALEAIKALNAAEWPFFIEEDSVVSINDDADD